MANLGALKVFLAGLVLLFLADMLASMQSATDWDAIGVPLSIASCIIVGLLIARVTAKLWWIGFPIVTLYYAVPTQAHATESIIRYGIRYPLNVATVLMVAWLTSARVRHTSSVTISARLYARRRVLVAACLLLVLTVGASCEYAHLVFWRHRFVDSWLELDTAIVGGLADATHGWRTAPSHLGQLLSRVGPVRSVWVANSDGLLARVVCLSPRRRSQPAVLVEYGHPPIYRRLWYCDGRCRTEMRGFFALAALRQARRPIPPIRYGEYRVISLSAERKPGNRGRVNRDR